MQRLTLIVIASALTLAAAPQPVAAEEITVDVSDVDLHSQAGADRALGRIRQAAEQVCDVRRIKQPLSERRAARACVQEAMDDAVADLNAPLVSSRY